MSDFNFDAQFGFRPTSEQKPPEELGKVSLAEELFVDVATVAEENFPHGKYLKTANGESEYILDENGRTILLFGGDGGGKFNSVYSPLSKEQLTRELLALPESQHQQLRELLELPEPTQNDLLAFHDVQERRRQETQMLNEVLQLPTSIHRRREGDIPEQDQIRGIIQKEYAITDAHGEKPVIGTYGLGPCIAMTVYEADTQTAAIAHIDGTTNVDSLSRVLSEFGNRDSLDIRLIGGDGSSRKQAIQIIQFLRDQGVQISHADILDKPHPSAFVIDSRTGEIIPNITPRDNGEADDLRMQAAGLQMNAQIKKEFEGRSI